MYLFCNLFFKFLSSVNLRKALFHFYLVSLKEMANKHDTHY
jgi:hypothetical protein